MKFFLDASSVSFETNLYYHIITNERKVVIVDSQSMDIDRISLINVINDIVVYLNMCPRKFILGKKQLILIIITVCCLIFFPPDIYLKFFPVT